MQIQHVSPTVSVSTDVLTAYVHYKRNKGNYSGLAYQMLTSLTSQKPTLTNHSVQFFRFEALPILMIFKTVILVMHSTSVVGVLIG
jgi:heme oxygenase